LARQLRPLKLPRQSLPDLSEVRLAGGCLDKPGGWEQWGVIDDHTRRRGGCSISPDDRPTHGEGVEGIFIERGADIVIGWKPSCTDKQIIRPVSASQFPNHASAVLWVRIVGTAWASSRLSSMESSREPRGKPRAPSPKPH